MAVSPMFCAMLVTLIADRLTYASSWNYDQNRLKLLNRHQQLNRSNVEYNGYSSHNQNSQNSRIPQPRSSNDHRSGRTINPSSPYSSFNPVIITARKPNVYKSVEDPKDFYNNKTKYGIVMRRFKPGLENKLTSPSSYMINKYTNRNSTEAFNNQHKGSIRQRGSVNNYQGKQIMRTQNVNSVNTGYSEFKNKQYNTVVTCIRCPAERTVIASKGRERVVLEMPELYDCNGNLASASTTFNNLYGPKIGSILKEGSHVTVGRIMNKNQTLQLCQYRLNVIVRRCPDISLSSDVEAKCLRNSAWGTTCRFKCKINNPPFDMKGPYRTKCLDDLTWSSPPPTCHAQSHLSDSWCDMPKIPKRAVLDCETTDGEAPPTGIPEGSECKFSCIDYQNNDDSQKNLSSHSIVCKSGMWYGQLPFCVNQRRRRHKVQKKISINKKL